MSKKAQVAQALAKHKKPKRSGLKAGRQRFRYATLVVFVVVALAGVLWVRFGFAASHVVVAEAENGTVNGAAGRHVGAAGASAGNAVRFGVSTATPAFDAEELVSGKNRIWDIITLPSGGLLFTERAGRLSLYKNGAVTTVATISDVNALNLGGLMGLAIDPQYATNKYIYACMNSTAGDIRVVRWQFDGSSLSDRRDIVTGILQHDKAYHSGCRLGFGADGYLWIGTGDATIFGAAQDPKSLGGKVLHVTRDGAAAPGNQGGNFEARIFNYGHRNTQGMAFFSAPKNGVYGLSVEHGADDDDEVNELRNGNFGWAPFADGSKKYQEIEIDIPMTDFQKYPNAVGPIWKSGSETVAPSGATIINGFQWKGWDGAVAVAMLKGQHLMILRLDDTNKVTRVEKILQGTYGRLRTAVQGPDGVLYISTDNGTNDRIIKLTPRP